MEASMEPRSLRPTTERGSFDPKIQNEEHHEKYGLAFDVSSPCSKPICVCE
jgi:hypothetical protein